jgi:hypothetical protein
MAPEPMTSKRNRRTIRTGITLLVLAGIVILLSIGFHLATDVRPPVIADTSSLALKAEQPDTDFFRIGSNWLKKSRSGLWEMYIEGKPFDRGVIIGKLSERLIYGQEKAFVGRIRELVPSPFYQRFLKYFIYWFNRNLDRYIAEEYLQEIYGVSFSASAEFSFIGEPYQRLLNYHSAHDIGHALQDLSLVGCTSFGAWSGMTRDRNLIVGRNFDFYAGDDFAKNKIVCFVKPDSGYRFMMVTWGGMTGAVSGMNEKGLTVTINAAKSRIPYSARTPISLVTREILQYASNLREAYRIACSRETFVSESILVGSAADNKAVVFEKSPYRIEWLESGSDYIVCANHFRSKPFLADPLNAKDMRENASVYRYRRVLQALTDERPLDPDGVARILRDRTGLNGRDIGMGNEKAVNQLIAHHSVIFEPVKRRVWVSAGPWQEGSYVCYDISDIFNNFAGLDKKAEITEPELEIAPDPFLATGQYQDLLRFRESRDSMKAFLQRKDRRKLPDSSVHLLTALNPEFYEGYELAGDYYDRLNLTDSSLRSYRAALSKEIPRQAEKERIIRKLTDQIWKKRQTEK